MSQELQDFQYFQQNQLLAFDPVTGQIDAKSTTVQRTFMNVGSENADGYVRLWANGKLRMKHRLVYFLVHGSLPPAGYEIDHINSIRNDNRPANIRSVLKSVNNSGCANRKFGRQFTKDEVEEICELLATTTLSDLLIAEKTGASRATVRDIKMRRSRASISKAYQWPHRV